MSAMAYDDKSKRASKFDPPGVNFKGKLIGVEDVTDPRGDKMCQVAMAKLKAAVVAMGEHKQRITINISMEGIKILDEKSENLHQHPVHRISFISRDTNDSRAFGYVYNREDGAHQFIGIKTEKAAEPLVTSLRELFQTVVDLKKEKERELAKNGGVAISTAVENKEKPKEESQPEAKPTPSTDLLGLDSGVAGIDKGMSQLNTQGSASTPSPSSAWLDNSLFQGAPVGAAPAAVPPQTGAFPMAATLPSGVVFQGQAPPVTGIAVAATMYQQPSYPQAAGMQGVPYGSFPASFPPSQHPAGVFQQQQQQQSPWQQAQAPASAAKPNSWMSFDSSTQVSSIFGDPTGSGSSPFASASGPLQPTSGKPPNDPFAAPAGFPDPFADLGVLSVTSGSSSQLGKKASREDFIKEPSKPPSLFDLSQQQHQQQPGTDQGLPPSDPFSGVSLPQRRSPYNPFEPPQHQHHDQGLTSTSHVDKSPAFLNPFEPSSVVNDTTDFGASTPTRADPADAASGHVVSRPRPKGSKGLKPILVLPLESKTNDPFGISDT